MADRIVRVAFLALVAMFLMLVGAIGFGLWMIYEAPGQAVILE